MPVKNHVCPACMRRRCSGLYSWLWHFCDFDLASRRSALFDNKIAFLKSLEFICSKNGTQDVCKWSSHICCKLFLPDLHTIIQPHRIFIKKLLTSLDVEHFFKLDVLSDLHFILYSKSIDLYAHWTESMQSFCLIVCISNSLINHWRTDQIKYPLPINGNMMIVNEIGTVTRLACRDQIFSIELWERYIYRWTFLQYLLLFVSCSIVCGWGALCSAASTKSTYCALSICLLGEIHSGKRAAFLSALPPEECFWRVPRLQNGGWPMAPAASVPRRRIFPRICRQNSTHFITPISTDRRKKKTQLILAIRRGTCYMPPCRQFVLCHSIDWRWVSPQEACRLAIAQEHLLYRRRPNISFRRLQSVHRHGQTGERKQSASLKVDRVVY